MNYVLMPIAHGVEFKQVQNDYAQPLIEKIKSYLTDEEKNFLVPAPYNYTIKTDPRQIAMFNAVEQGLGNQELRRLKHTVGSDVTWSFIIAKDGKECFYIDFVKDVTNLINDYRIKYNGIKVLCLGHSQGTQLFYSFFFDYNKIIDVFISMGSPISMNSGAYPDFGKAPSILGKWVNFYHRMDFIASRLQGVHPAKSISNFVIDYEVPSAWWKLLYNLPTGLCKALLLAGLMAHVSYWQSNFVAMKIAEEVKKLIHQPA